MEFKNNTNADQSRGGTGLDYLASRVTLIIIQGGGKSTMYINVELIDSKNAVNAIGAKMFLDMTPQEIQC